jgi:hypothetical protein
MEPRPLTHSVQSTTLGDLLERVLDKGLVVAGDIRIKLVDVELLTIQLRLVVCSVDRAKEIGLDWWRADYAGFGASPLGEAPILGRVEERLARLEQRLERLGEHHE